jgi:Na+-translocating ferredoxin:NAD+ oxidoreductase subunit D
MSRAKALSMGEAPFAFNKRTSASLMWGTAAALLPALAWGIYCFGYGAALPVACSLAGALAGEAMASGLRRRFTLWDGSAFLTGILVGMAMPAGISPFIPAIASLFAVSVVKGAFGGLGSNWMNPALAGIAFALLNWPAEMNAWTWPHQLAGLSAVSGATPLGLARAGAGSAAVGSNPIDILSAGGMRFSGIDSTVTDALNRGFFSPLGAELPGGYIDLLVGNKAGALGELSGLLILAASIFLISRKIIRWEIPASIVGSFAVLTWAFGGLALGKGFFAGDALFSILSGSFLIVTFFMAPDPVTSPSSRPSMMLYGAGVGALTFLLRSFGSSAEGSAFAVILMNCAVPAISKIDVAAFRRRAARVSEPASEGAKNRGGR